MDFQQWFEVKFDPSLTNLYKWAPSDKPRIGASFNLKVDPAGNIVPLSDEDWRDRSPHYEINPRTQQIQLQRLSPVSPEFHKLIKALRSKYPDINNWQVEVFGQAAHMQTGRGKWHRTVGYWLGQEPVDLNNKLPMFMYHGTSTNLWYGGIKAKGLLPRNLSGNVGSYGAQNVDSLSQPDLIYLSVHPDAGTREAARQAAKKHGGRPLILQINSSGLFPERFVPDEDSRMKTAQDSIRAMGVAAYSGRIGASVIKPYLLGREGSKGNLVTVDWVKFSEVPVDEHPIAAKLRAGELPYHGEPEYYALKDAGIIGHEEKYDDRGFRSERLVKKRDVSDEELRKIMKNMSWTQNVRAIVHDLNKGYSGALYYLKDRTVPENLTGRQQEMIDLLLDSGILHIEKSGEHRYFDLNTWNNEKYAMKLAKLMGRMSFKDMANELKSIQD